MGMILEIKNAGLGWLSAMILGIVLFAPDVLGSGGPPVLLDWGTIQSASPEQQIKSRAVRSSAQPMPSQRLSARGAAPWLVQFDDVIREEWKSDLAAAGAELNGYIPENAFLVTATPKQMATISAMTSVVWVGEYLPAYKRARPVRVWLAEGKQETRIFNVILFDPGDVARVRDEMSGLPGVLIQRAEPLTDRGLIRADLSVAALEEVSNWSEVEWIEPYIRPTLRNDVAVRANKMNVTNAWSVLGLTGAGQIIAVADTGLDTGNTNTLHRDFTNRVKGFGWSSGSYSPATSWADSDSHGTHVAGSVLGSGFSSTNRFRGTAYQAELIMQGVQTNLNGLPSDLNTLFRQAFTNGARIHSNSWGYDDNGGYNIDSRYVDMYMWSNKTMLILVAAGNSGIDANSNGVVDLGSVGSPATAKNCLAVGASENYRLSGGYSTSRWGIELWPTDYPAEPIRSDYASRPDSPQGMAAFSSRGPCLDGRIKPDVVAPGTDIVSTRSKSSTDTGWGTVAGNTNYLYMGGTSMATPLVAGAAGLVRQWLVTSGGITNPSAALVKAILMNGARNMAPGQYGTGATQEIPNARPNNVQGWGHVDVYNSLNPPTNWVLRLVDTNSLSTGQSNRFSYAVGSTTTNKFVITLAYTDYFAASGSGKKLINDLDLTVRKPSGAVLYANGRANLDATNNVETIEFAPDETGTYIVQVHARTVPQGGSQPYALVVLEPVTAAPNPPPPAPAAIWASTTNVYDFTAAWSSVAAATGYRLDVSEHPSFAGSGGGGSTNTETFANVGGGTTSSYLTRSWTNNGVAWTAFKARTDQTINGGSSVCLQREAGAYFVSGIISGGVDTIQLTCEQKFTGSGGTYDVFVNDIKVASAVPITTSVQTNLISNIGVSGTFTIMVTNSGSVRPAFNDLKWSVGQSSAPSYVPGYSNRTVGGTSQAVTGLTAETTYYLRARAVNADGVSSNSPVASVATKGLGPSPTAIFGAVRIVGEEGGDTVALPVMLSSSVDAVVQVRFSGTAQYGVDFTGPTSLVFSAGGPTVSNLVWTIVDDTLPEGPESVRISLHSVSGVTNGAATNATLLIRDNDAFSVVAANLSSGASQQYEAPGARILQALGSDIALVQEFNMTNGITPRAWVDQHFGTNFHLYVQTNAWAFIPPGIISRWPIVEAGIWPDYEVGNRDFVWARIAIPGPRPLYAVSVHFKAEPSAAIREAQARALTNYIAQAGILPENLLVVGGDFNLLNRSEAALMALTNHTVTDARQPADQVGNRNTNSGRNNPYDLILPSAGLDALHRTFAFYGYTFTNGMVFDTRITWANGLPRPALAADSSADGMQHMAVMKVFELEAPGLPPPASLVAEAVSAVQVNLAFEQNAGGNDVVMVWNTDGNFGAPSGTAPAVGAAFAGGTVLYKGAVSPQSHTGRTSCSTYFYKAWSFSGTNYSAEGLTANAVTFALPPPSAVWTSVTNATDFTAAWSAATGATSYRLDVSAVSNFAGEGDALYTVDFEGAGETKTAYASGTNSLSGKPWDLTEALIGTDTADWKNGTRSTRMRGYGSSAMTMLEDLTDGLGTLSFSYRRYGTDAQVDWKAEYSADGGSSWSPIGSSFTAPASDDVQSFSESVNVAGNVRVRIKRATETGASNARLNIDDIVMTSASAFAYVPGYSNRLVAAGTSESVTGLMMGVTYYFRVRAADDVCVSGNSPTGQATTLAQISALVYLQDLLQTYSGAPISVTATTDPAGLTVAFTYDGSVNEPVNAGSYAVTGTVITAPYQGLASGVLVIEPAAQSITFANPGDQIVTNIVELNASADSGLPVTISVISGPAFIDGNSLSFAGTGAVAIAAHQSGDANWLAAVSVTNTLVVFAFADANENQIPDEWEMDNFGSLDAVTETSDADEDGMFDWQEYVAGTDPNDAASRLWLEANPQPGSGPALIIQWSSESNRYYAIGRKTNWVDAFLFYTSGLPAIPPMNVHTDAPPGEGPWYYRIKVGLEP